MGNLCPQRKDDTKEDNVEQNSRPTSESDTLLKELSHETGFTYRMVEQLRNRFNELTKHRIGRTKTSAEVLKPKDLFSIPEFKSNPLNKRIADVFFSYAKDHQSMDLEEFITTLAKFKTYSHLPKEEKKIRREEKLRFLFRIYDTNNSKYITYEDICETLKGALPKGSHLQEKISELAEQMLKEMDRDGDGQISFEDYSQTLANVDIDAKINLPFLNRRI